eukprot:6201230-Pleurochrysis_carterae.AAC.2
MLVVDEADRILEIGFEEDLRAIVKLLPQKRCRKQSEQSILPLRITMLVIQLTIACLANPAVTIAANAHTPQLHLCAQPARVGASTHMSIRFCS